MKNGLCRLAVVAVGLALMAGMPNWAAADAPSAPWQIATIAKLNQTNADQPAAAPESGSQKYLHIKLGLNLPAAERKLHQFRIVDRRGEEVGELWGFTQSTVIFEGKWDDLGGLFLDGLGRREPLVRVAEPAPSRNVQTAQPPLVASPPMVSAPVVVQSPAPRVFNTPAPIGPSIVTRVPDRVVVSEQPKSVIIDPGVTVGPRSNDRIYVAPSVIHDGGDRVIVHDSGPEHVYVHDGGDRVVVHDDDRVIHDGNRIVVHDGTRVVHDGDRVVVHDGDTVVHDGTRVVHDGDRVVHDGTRVVHDGDTVVHDGTGGGHGRKHKHHHVVVHDGKDVVVDDGDDHVVHDGDKVVHDTDRVVHKDGDDTVVVHDGDKTVRGSDKVVVHDGDNVVHDGSTYHGMVHETAHAAKDSDDRVASLDSSGAGGKGTGGNGSGSGSGSGNGSGAGSGSGTGSGTGSGSGPGKDSGPGDKAAGDKPGQGKPDQAKADQCKPDQGKPCPCQANAQGNAPGQGAGSGNGAGAGSGSGPGAGSGAGPGSGPGAGLGAARGLGPAGGPGMGPGGRPGMGAGGLGLGGAIGPAPLAPIGPVGGLLGPARPIGPLVPNLNATTNLVDPRLVPVGPLGPAAIGSGGQSNQLASSGAGGGGAAGAAAAMPQIGVDGKAGPSGDRPHYAIYVTCGEDTGPGKVYQLDEQGRVQGVVHLASTATGIALHRQNALVLAVPRAGGHILRIDDAGRLSSIVDRDKLLIHPVDVAVASNSDTVLVADNIAKVLATVPATGGAVKIYRGLGDDKWTTAPELSIAATTDGHVLFGSSALRGIIRLQGPADPLRPLWTGAGGVAADTASLRWAAAAAPGFVATYDGEEPLAKLRLPPGKSIYRQGLLSFAPGGLLLAARESNQPDGQPTFLRYNPDTGDVENLFTWNRERVMDFVVGPRMLWDRDARAAPQSAY